MKIMEEISLIVVSLVYVVSGQKENNFQVQKNSEFREMQMTPGFIRKNYKACDAIAVDPFFDEDRVLDKSWRVYNFWNMDLGNKCVDIDFAVATPEIIDRVKYNVGLHLAEQPVWEKASLLVTLGLRRQTLLLIPTGEQSGRYQAVVTEYTDTSQRMMHLLLYQFKLYNGGQMLLMLDCEVGIAALSLPVNVIPYRMQIESIVNILSPIIDVGRPACTDDHRNKDEIIGESEKPKAAQEA